MRKSVREGYVKHTWYLTREHELWIPDTWFRYCRQGVPIDVSSVVRAILYIAREEAEKNPDLILRWAEGASLEDRQNPTHLSALVESGGTRFSGGCAPPWPESTAPPESSPTPWTR